MGLRQADSWFTDCWAAPSGVQRYSWRLSNRWSRARSRLAARERTVPGCLPLAMNFPSGTLNIFQ